MIIIAHRGNLYGPQESKENHPDTIEYAIKQGFHVEIDLWVDEQEQWFLGHDQPQYKVTSDWVQKRRDSLWVHAKNLKALRHIVSQGLRGFWHQNDQYTMTTQGGWIWTYPGEPTVRGCILVLQGELPEHVEPKSVSGYCTDYPVALRQRLQRK